MTTLLFRRMALLASGLLCALPLLVHASQGHAPTTADIDRPVIRTLKELSVPGIAVGIVEDGKLALAKGYGVREQGKPGGVDPNTLFAS